MICFALENSFVLENFVCTFIYYQIGQGFPIFDHCASSVGVSHVAISQILWLGYRHIMSYGQAHTSFRLPAAAGNLISP